MPAGRPRLEAGSFGKIKVTGPLANGKYQARTLYRDNLGKRHEAVKYGTKAGCENALKKHMVEVVLPGLAARTITKGSTIAQLAEMFLEKKRAAGLAPASLDTYSGNLHHIVLPKLGEMLVADATPMLLQDFINEVAAENGPGAAKGCRSVLSGMMSMAVINGITNDNPVRSLERIKRKAGHRGSTALKPAELVLMREACRTDAELLFRGVGPIWEFMSYVGCRIGEALALRDSMVDTEAGTITLGPSVSRVKGGGLTIYEPGKTATEQSIGWRTIVVPDRAMAIVKERMGHPSGLVFCSMLGHLRDPANTERDWRNNRERLGFPTFTPHGFRKTVATMLDEAGLSARDVADYLGHKNPSMTQDVYMAKNTQTARAAGVLNSHFIPTNQLQETAELAS